MIVNEGFSTTLAGFSQFTCKVRKHRNTFWGEVIGALDLSQSLLVWVFLIANEWVEWLPTLDYVHIQLSWIWIQDEHWAKNIIIVSHL